MVDFGCSDWGWGANDAWWDECKVEWKRWDDEWYKCIGKS